METLRGMKLGEILAELRDDRGLTQRELSKQLHISSSSISAYETGARLPNIDTLVEFSTFYDVTIDYLVGLTTHPVSPTVLTQEYVGGVSMASVIKKMLALTPEQRTTLYSIIESFKFYTDVKRKTTDEGNETL
jgi:transcriptional regulator with XRE-family HTH domain